MRALITGITGSGGSYLADHIVAHRPDVEVHGIARWHSTSTDGNLRQAAGRAVVHECDLRDFSAVLRVLQEVRPELVFHIASHANVRASFVNPLAVLDNNVMGTANLLEAIRSAGLDPVVQICSTSEVYGQVDPRHVPITEDCPINPSSPYAVSKVAQDFLGYTYFKSYGMKVIRTRMFAYLNPRRRDLFATAFAMQVARIELGRQRELRHGNLDSVRTLIDVRDAVAAYWAAIELGEPGQVYNIGGVSTVTVGEFLEALKKRARCEIPSRLDPALLRPSDVTLQIPDTSRFRARTGWAPRYTLEESTAMLLEHCRGEARREAAEG